MFPNEIQETDKKKVCVQNVERQSSLPLLRSPEAMLPNLEPTRILELRTTNRNDMTQYKFVVVFVCVCNQNTKRNYLIDNLGFLTERYKTWLLARFKTNLRDLAVVKMVATWTSSQLEVLKNYCLLAEINYSELYQRSTLPPTQVYLNNSHRTSIILMKQMEKKERQTLTVLKEEKIANTKQLKEESWVLSQPVLDYGLKGKQENNSAMKRIKESDSEIKPTIIKQKVKVQRCIQLGEPIASQKNILLQKLNALKEKYALKTHFRIKTTEFLGDLNGVWDGILKL